MKQSQILHGITATLAALALTACNSPAQEDVLTLASGSGQNPFGGSTITLADFENGAGTLTPAPENYDFTYPDVAALPEYDVYLYEHGEDPVTEIYALDADMTPSSGSAGPAFEAACDQDYEEFYDEEDKTLIIICHNTGTTCHNVNTFQGTTIIVRCLQE